MPKSAEYGSATEEPAVVCVSTNDSLYRNVPFEVLAELITAGCFQIRHRLSVIDDRKPPSQETYRKRSFYHYHVCVEFHRRDSLLQKVPRRRKTHGMRVH